MALYLGLYGPLIIFYFSTDKQLVKLEIKQVLSFKSQNSRNALHIGYEYGEESRAKKEGHLYCTSRLVLMLGLSCFCHGQLYVNLWTVACQALLSMGFFRQEGWIVLSFPSLGDLPNPGIEPAALISPVQAGGFFTTSATWEALSGSRAAPRHHHPQPATPSIT